MEKISVIIPVYNVESFLKKCVDSIINQTYPNLEIILVDDGSPDNCGRLCDEFAANDSRIVVIHKENGGLSDARNVGISASSGEYITFVDSDDYVAKDYVEFLYDLIKKEDNIDISVCCCSAVYGLDNVIDNTTNYFAVSNPHDALENMLYDRGIGVSAWAKLYSRRIFENVRFPKGRLFEDSAVVQKTFLQCKKISIGLVSKYFYIIRGNSITNDNFTKSKMDLIKSTEEMCDEIVLTYPDLKSACNRRIMYAYLSTLTQLAMSKQRFPYEQKVLMKYIRANRFDVLKDSSIPKRDRVALISTVFGFWFFKLIWKAYRGFTGRKKRYSSNA